MSLNGKCTKSYHDRNLIDFYVYDVTVFFHFSTLSISETNIFVFVDERRSRAKGPLNLQPF